MTAKALPIKSGLAPALEPALKPALEPVRNRDFLDWIAAHPHSHFAAGSVLCGPDQAPSKVWLVRSGLVRVYVCSADGHEFNRTFVGPNEWVFGRLVWRDGVVCCADQAIAAQALTATHASAITVADLLRWQAADPQAAALMSDVMLQATAASWAREADLIQLSAKQRYADLLAKQPQLLEHVTLVQIAAWLGITPVALSRIRKQSGFRSK